MYTICITIVLIDHVLLPIYIDKVCIISIHTGPCWIIHSECFLIRLYLNYNSSEWQLICVIKTHLSMKNEIPQMGRTWLVSLGSIRYLQFSKFLRIIQIYSKTDKETLCMIFSQLYCSIVTFYSHCICLIIQFKHKSNLYIAQSVKLQSEESKTFPVKFLWTLFTI